MAKFLVAGYGSIGKCHASVLRDLGHKVVSYDPNPNAGATTSRLPDEMQWEAGWESYDGVLLCMHPNARGWWLRHVPNTLPLFVEKPLGIDAFSLSHTTRRIMVGFCWRWNLALKAFRSEFQEQRICSMGIYGGHWLPNWHDEPHTERYHGTPGLGGVINDSLSHALYIARWFLGDLELAGATYGHLSALDIQTEDVCAVLLRAKDTGIPCSINVDYLCRERRHAISVITPNGGGGWECMFTESEIDGMYERQMIRFVEVCEGERSYGYPTYMDGVAVQFLMNEVRDTGAR